MRGWRSVKLLRVHAFLSNFGPVPVVPRAHNETAFLSAAPPPALLDCCRSRSRWRIRGVALLILRRLRSILVYIFRTIHRPVCCIMCLGKPRKIAAEKTVDTPAEFVWPVQSRRGSGDGTTLCSILPQGVRSCTSCRSTPPFWGGSSDSTAAAVQPGHLGCGCGKWLEPLSLE